MGLSGLAHAAPARAGAGDAQSTGAKWTGLPFGYRHPKWLWVSASCKAQSPKADGRARALGRLAKSGDGGRVMIVCAASDIHGALDRLYEDVLAFEESLGVRFEWVLHVGDFGVWPDEPRIDNAMA